MRFRLRYLHHDLELTEGQFLIGRSTSCQLSLDDPLVSRKHAVLSVTEDVAAIEDLDSRNGVIVNGVRIDRPQTLVVGDRILIGAQELTLLQGRETGREATSSQIGNKTLPKVLTTPEFSSRRSSAPPPPLPQQTVESEADVSMVRRLTAFNLLGGVADKALALGRADEAERLLASALADVIEACRAGKLIPPPLADTAASFSAKLATATGKGVWSDYVIELYLSQGKLCPGNVIDELYGAFRKVNVVDQLRLRAYVLLLRRQLPSYGPADRFLFQRLEGLERLVALR